MEIEFFFKKMLGIDMFTALVLNIKAVAPTPRSSSTSMMFLCDAIKNVY
jgi:hypothetical protein